MKQYITNEEQAIRTKEFANTLRAADLNYDIVVAWNEYASEHAPDDIIFFDLREIADLLEASPVQFAQLIYFGDVQNWADDYFCFNGYANIVSFTSSRQGYCPIDFDKLAEWLVETESQLYTDFVEKNY